MGLEQFVIELLGKVMWPIVVLVLGLKLRQPIVELAGRIKRLRKGDASVDFDVPKLESKKLPQLGSGVEKLDETSGNADGTEDKTERPTKLSVQPESNKTARDENNKPTKGRTGKSQKAGKPTRKSTGKRTPVAEQLQVSPGEADLVEFAPAGAVISSWARFEEAMRTQIKRLELEDGDERAMTPMQLITRLAQARLLDEESVDAANRLRSDRNKVAHAGLSPTMEIAEQFVATIGELIRRLVATADAVKLARLLQGAEASSIASLLVAPLVPIPLSAEWENARQEAPDDYWLAIGERAHVVNEQDAAFLLKLGAQLGDPPTALVQELFAPEPPNTAD